jgi:hypothetical protein
MDPTKEKTMEEIAQELNDVISNPGNYTGTIGTSITDDTITLSDGSESDYSTVYTLDNSVNVGGLTFNYPNTMSTGSGSYSLGGAGVSSPWTVNSSMTYPSSAKIKLDGEGADIEVNGWSLIDAIKKIEERLNILTPNPELESEWAELKRLGDRYRKLEKKIQDKMGTWDRLKAMPKIHID